MALFMEVIAFNKLTIIWATKEYNFYLIENIKNDLTIIMQQAVK